MAQSGLDRRRINGPEESFPPIFDAEETVIAEASQSKSRQGRGAKDIRPICTMSTVAQSFLFLVITMPTDLKPGLISQANGSAYIETAKTKIACAVFVQTLFNNSYFTYQ